MRDSDLDLFKFSDKINQEESLDMILMNYHRYSEGL